MASLKHTQRRSLSNIAGLIGFLIVCLAVAAIGGAITATSVTTWYPTLDKPAFNPPDWVFGPVWTTLYILMAIAGWRVWRHPRSTARRDALLVFAVQLGLNVTWSLLFFGLQQIGMALFEIVVLLFTIIVNMILFWRIERFAGALFIPYVLWVAFATLLNAALWLRN